MCLFCYLASHCLLLLRLWMSEASQCFLQRSSQNRKFRLSKKICRRRSASQRLSVFVKSEINESEMNACFCFCVTICFTFSNGLKHKHQSKATSHSKCHCLGASNNYLVVTNCTMLSIKCCPLLHLKLTAYTESIIVRGKECVCAGPCSCAEQVFKDGWCSAFH